MIFHERHYIERFGVKMNCCAFMSWGARAAVALAVAASVVAPAPLALAPHAGSAQPALAASRGSDAKTSGYFKYRIEKDGTATIVGYDGDAIEQTYTLYYVLAHEGEPIEVPAQVGGAPVRAIGSRALDLSYNFETYGHFKLPEGLERIGDRALMNTSVHNLPSTLKAIGDKAFASGPSGIDDDDSRYVKTRVDVGGSLPAGLESVGYKCFFEAWIGKSVRIPASLEAIGDEAFNCTGLERIEVDKGNKSYKAVDGVLYEKKGGALVSYPLGKTGAVKVLSGAKAVPSRFFAYGKVKSVVLPKSVTRVGAFAFAECPKLASVDLPDGVTKLGRFAFDGCKKLKSIHMPKKLSSIGDCAFQECKSLKGKIVVPKRVKKVSENAFAYCTSLEKVDAEGVRTVDDGAFKSCKHLKKASLKKARTIGEGAFEGCKRLGSVTLGKSLKKVGAGAFSGTSKKLAFKAPKSKVKAYKKLLKKAGVKKPKVRAL